jgi:hypothetical protein
MNAEYTEQDSYLNFKTKYENETDANWNDMLTELSGSSWEDIISSPSTVGNISLKMKDLDFPANTLDDISSTEFSKLLYQDLTKVEFEIIKDEYDVNEWDYKEDNEDKFNFQFKDEFYKLKNHPTDPVGKVK